MFIRIQNCYYVFSNRKRSSHSKEVNGAKEEKEVNTTQNSAGLAFSEKENPAENYLLGDQDIKTRSLPAIPIHKPKEKPKEKTAQLHLLSMYSVQECQELNPEQPVKLIYCTSTDIPDLISGCDSGQVVKSGQLMVKQHLYQRVPDEKHHSGTSATYEFIDDVVAEAEMMGKEDMEDGFVLVENDIYSGGYDEDAETNL